MKNYFTNNKLVTSFQKYLKSSTGQIVVEYCLVLVVLAAILLSLFANNFAPIQGMFNATTNRVMDRIVSAPPGAP